MTTLFAGLGTLLRIRAARFALLLAVVSLASGAHAQHLGNFCGWGTCDITNPNFVNIYWDTSLAQWDSDATIGVNATFTHDHIDHLTEAIVNSNFFTAAGQYSVTGATFGGSLASGGGCIAAPSTLDKAKAALATLVNCVLAAHPSLVAGNTIVNVFVPPQSMDVPLICEPGDGAERAEHSQYGTAVGVTFIPTTKACGTDLASLFRAVTHEMIEATTDPNPPSPTGWKDGDIGDFYGQEAGDLCENTMFSDTPFLWAKLSTYWSNSLNNCTPGTAKVFPVISTATACGTGQSMTFTLTGTFGNVPWDLTQKKFGNQSMYVRARISHNNSTWGAGDPEGLPSDSVNGGKPDVVHWASPVNWSNGTITLSGFDNNYGKTMSNGAVALVYPGNVITLTVFNMANGLSAKTTVAAPSGKQIIDLAVNPKGGDPFVFVNKHGDLSGQLVDSGKCGIEAALILYSTGMGAFLNPSSGPTDAAGNFHSDFTGQQIAGLAPVAASLYNFSGIKQEIQVPVHPILNSITPNIGPVKGGQKATLAGDGFDSTDGNSTVAFSGAAAKVQNIALQSAAVVTPQSPLPNDGDGIADVIITVNGLDSLSVPYHYIVPGKPYIEYKSQGCKTHSIVVTVYDDNAQPVVVPIHLSAGYAAYMDNGQWVTQMDTTSGTQVQVDKGGPFTATNKQNSKSATASFPVLPNGICANIRNITKIDWHIFEKTNVVDPVEIPQFKGGKKVVIWSRDPAKSTNNYVLDPSGAPGGITVSTVGPEKMRGAIHGGIFLSGGAKTESAPGNQGCNSLDVQFAGPAFDIERAGQSGGPLGRKVQLVFALPAERAFTHKFNIVHLSKSGEQASWADDGKDTHLMPYNQGITRSVSEGGIYALLEQTGCNNQPEERQEQPQQQPQRHNPPSQPQPQSAPPNSTVLVPEQAFPGGVLTGVVIGPDDKPVPNTPVDIVGGVPATLTGEVVGDQPEQPNQPSQPTTPSRPPVDCASLLQRGVPPANAPGSVPSPTGAPGANPAGAVTDAAGRFAVCVPVDAPKVDVDLGGQKTSVPIVTGTPDLPGTPPTFFQPRQRVSVIGVLRRLHVKQGGRDWTPPQVESWNGDGTQVITAFQTPRDLELGPADLTYTGGDGQPHEVHGSVFRVVRATLDRSRLRSDQGATFEYDVQFAGQSGQNLCVNMQWNGPITMVEAPPQVIAIDAGGMGKVVGRIRATQVSTGAVVPFTLTPNFHACQ